MKFIMNIGLVFLLALCALAVTPEKQVIVSYPKNTPQHVIDAAKKAVEDAGGIIIHEYNLIAGFAAKAPTKIFETIQAMGAEDNVLIEEDTTVSINSS